MIIDLIIKILFGKEVELMAMIYVALIIKGKKTFSDVPDKLKPQVKQILIDLDMPELAE